MDSGKLVVLSAPSGSGKTSLVKELLNEKLNLGFSISATSRAPRGKEKNNLDYYFLSHDEFVEKINENAFLEYEEVYKGTFYGTLNNEIKRILKPGGLNIYTVRNTEDGDFKKGIHRGEDLFEIDGFIIHFFSENKINSLLDGFKNLFIEKFDEGKFPRKLYLVCNKKI